MTDTRAQRIEAAAEEMLSWTHRTRWSEEIFQADLQAIRDARAIPAEPITMKTPELDKYREPRSMADCSTGERESVWRTLTRIVKNREKQIALHHEMGRAIARNTMKKDGLDELSIGVTEYWGLRKAYEKCLKEGVDLFQHEGRAFDIGYAYYLLEYLTPRIKQMDHGDWKYSKPIPKPGYTEEVICELPSGNECAEEDLS